MELGRNKMIFFFLKSIFVFLKKVSFEAELEKEWTKSK